MFIAALLTVAERDKQFKCPSADNEQTNSGKYKQWNAIQP